MVKNSSGKGATQKVPSPSDRKQQSMLDKMDAVLKKLPPGTFAKAGAAVGGLAGPKGAMIGGMIGKGISTITGRGDYVVRSNTLRREGGVLTTGVPKFVSNTSRNVRIQHRECFGAVSSPTNAINFNSSTYSINPGNEVLFPWLSSIASNYEKYKIHGAVVYFESSSSDYAASGALGNVIIATNYNSAEIPWSDDISMLNSEFAVAGKPSFNLAHPLECSPLYGGQDDYLYVRDAAAISGSTTVDPRLYDFGLLQVATRGLSAAVGTELGRLWVTYDIEFVRPLINPSGSMKYGTTSLSANVSDPFTTMFAIDSKKTVTGQAFVRTFPNAASFPGLTVNDTLVVYKGASLHQFVILVNRDCVLHIGAEIGTATGLTGTGTIALTNNGGATSATIYQAELVAPTEANASFCVMVKGASARPEAHVVVTVNMAASSATVQFGSLGLTVVEGSGVTRILAGNPF